MQDPFLENSVSQPSSDSNWWLKMAGAFKILYTRQTGHMMMTVTNWTPWNVQKKKTKITQKKVSNSLRGPSMLDAQREGRIIPRNRKINSRTALKLNHKLSHSVAIESQTLAQRCNWITNSRSALHATCRNRCGDNAVWLCPRVSLPTQSFAAATCPESYSKCPDSLSLPC